MSRKHWEKEKLRVTFHKVLLFTADTEKPGLVWERVKWFMQNSQPVNRMTDSVYWFVTTLIGNPKDTISHSAAHIQYTQSNLFHYDITG